MFIKRAAFVFGEAAALLLSRSSRVMEVPCILIAFLQPCGIHNGAFTYHQHHYNPLPHTHHPFRAQQSAVDFFLPNDFSGKLSPVELSKLGTTTNYTRIIIVYGGVEKGSKKQNYNRLFQFLKKVEGRKSFPIKLKLVLS